MQITFQIKNSLVDIEPSIWRRIIVPSNSMLGSKRWTKSLVSRPVFNEGVVSSLRMGFMSGRKKGAPNAPTAHAKGSRPIRSLRGLWDIWRSPIGEIVNSCTIITTTPNKLMEPLHNRMPVILPRDVEETWLDQGIIDRTFLKSLLVSYPSDQMTAYEVSPFVNSVKNNGIKCLMGVGDRLFKGFIG